MSLVYRVMYRIGFTPWDTGTVAAELGTLVEGDGGAARRPRPRRRVEYRLLQGRRHRAAKPRSVAGVDETEVVARFDGWELIATQRDSDGDPPGPMRNIPRTWYRLTRR